MSRGFPSPHISSFSTISPPLLVVHRLKMKNKPSARVPIAVPSSLRPESGVQDTRGAECAFSKTIDSRTETTKHDGVVGGGKDQHYRFTVLADGLLRMEWAPDGVFEDRPSAFAAHRNEAQIPDYDVKESDDKLEILTSRFHMTYNKQEFSAYGLYAEVDGFTRSLWRFKEEGQSNLGGTFRTLDNIDGSIDRERKERIQLEPGILSRNGYALLDDSKSMLFTEDGFIAARKPGDDRIDCYLFAYGHSYRDALKAFYSISGRQPLIPRWALGNWWSRYYDYTAKTYLELVDRFAQEKVPLSVAVLDMGWHLVDDPKVKAAHSTGWTGYTWNRNFFPDPPAFIRELHRRKLKVTLNEHPADGVASYEDRYHDMAKALNFDTATKKPIPFDCVDRRYMQAYFDMLLRSLEHDGCDFWWIDWQQGPYSRLENVDPLWVLNHFHYQHNRNVMTSSPPMIFSRYGGPGSHRYPVGFSGDTYTTWASLDFQPAFTATASNIGYGWWSHDIGGHQGGTKSDELTTRWVQLGVFSPIMRLHSTQSKWVAKEPWRFPPPFSNIIASFMRLRHRMIPYLQTMNHRSASDSLPLIQPLYWEYPGRNEAYQYNNSYYFGSQMLVAPITAPMDPSLKLAKVKAWLPPGRYIDYFTKAVYEGDRTLWLSRTIDQIPVLLKEGSIVPLDAEETPINGAEVPDRLQLVVVVGADGEFVVREDKEVLNITYTQLDGRLDIKDLAGTKRAWKVLLLGMDQNSTVRCNQRSGSASMCGEGDGHFEIQNPRLQQTRANDHIEPVLREAQISYAVKDKVWQVLQDEKQSVATRIANIEALGLDENLRVFLVEYLSLEA